MKNKKMLPNTDKKKELSIPIVIAIIGVIGTICAASITAYFGYLSTRTQIEQPISYTQTAVSLFLSSQTATPMNGTQIPTQVLPSATANATTKEWEDKVEYSLKNSGCTISLATIIPESKNWDRNTQLTSELLNKTLNNPNINKAGLAPIFTFEPFTNFSIAFSVHSIVASNDWIKLENKVNFIVKPLPIDIPEYLHAFYFFGGCGGGEDKFFSSSIMNLQTGVNEYQISASSTTYDFFTLQPSEYDEYDFFFLCNTPGVYQIILEQQYEYQGASGKISKNDIPLLYCPKSLQVWTINARNPSADGAYHVEEQDIWNSDIYFWNGSGYSRP